MLSSALSKCDILDQDVVIIPEHPFFITVDDKNNSSNESFGYGGIDEPVAKIVVKNLGVEKYSHVVLIEIENNNENYIIQSLVIKANKRKRNPL